MDPGEASDERFGHAISKIFLAWITREIFQWQYRKRLDRGLSRSFETSTSAQHQNDCEECEHGCCPEQHPQAGRSKSLFDWWNRRSGGTRTRDLVRRADF